MKQIYFLTILTAMLSLSMKAQVCTGDFVFSSQTALDQFLLDNPTCDTIVGNVNIHLNSSDQPNDPLLDVNALQNITTVTGTLSIVGGGDLTGLNNLSTVGELRLYVFEGDISPLENLQNISTVFISIADQNDLHIFDDITTLESLRIELPAYEHWTEETELNDIFPSLTTVNDQLFIGSSSWGTYCDTLTGFEALTHVGSLYIGYGVLMDRFDAMHNLQTIGSGVIFDDWIVNSISGFENVQSFGTGMQMGIICQCDLPDFESLQYVNDMQLYNSALTQPDFPSLTQVNGNLEVSSNANSLGFINLETVQGNLEIYADGFDTNLYSFFGEIHMDSLREVYGNFVLHGTGVDNIDFLSNLDSVGGTMTIEDNFNLSNCEIDYLCQQLPIAPEMFVIENNLGCSSPEEVLATCGNSYVAGKVFYDLDCDGIFNNEDLGVAHPIIVNELNVPVSGSNALGEYFVPLNDISTSTFSISGMPLFTTTTHTITTGNSTEAFDNMNFPLCPTGDLHDVGVSAALNQPFRPGFNTYMNIHVRNYSIYTEDVEVVLNLDNMPGVSASLIYDSGVASGNSIIWNVEDIAPFSVVGVSVILHLNYSIPLGQVLTSSLSATLQPTTLVDISVNNNINSYSYTVVGSYDPNDISVNIQALNYDDFPSEGLTLDYLIRFQNTGTAPAEFVRVTDIIEDDLNLGSIQMLSSSHSFQLTFKENREVEWLFENIQLPDSTSDLDGSQGYIHYRIKTNPDVTIDGLIENTAAIYFDYNAPVITNTATTLFYTCPAQISATGTTEICEGETSSMMASDGYENYTWNINNQSVSTEQSFGLENLNAGNYTLEYEGTTEFCNSSNEVEITINAIPEVPIITQNVNTLTASGTGVFVWTFNGEVLSDTDNSINIDESGEYAVFVTTNDCASDVTMGNFIHTGIESINNEFDFTIYPNPVNNVLNITLSQSGKFNISIFDSSGKQILQFGFIGSKTAFACNTLCDGIYRMVLTNDKGEINLSKSFVVVRL